MINSGGGIVPDDMMPYWTDYTLLQLAPGGRTIGSYVAPAGVFVVAGQSLNINVAPTAYVPTSAPGKCQQISVHGLCVVITGTESGPGGILRLTCGDPAYWALLNEGEICTVIPGRYPISKAVGTPKFDLIGSKFSAGVLFADVYAFFNQNKNCIYNLVDPELGLQNAGNGCAYTRLMDALVNTGVFARTIIVNTSVGASAIDQWSAGGLLNHRLLIGLRKCRQLGVPVSAILWEQGQSEFGQPAIDRGKGNTTQAEYTARFKAMRNTAVGIGFDVPWFLARSTCQNGTSYAPVHSSIANDLVDNVKVFVGPDQDSYTGTTYRQADGTHWNDTGAVQSASNWHTVLSAAKTAGII